MKVVNLSRLNKNEIIALTYYAKRLYATDMVIHTDCSIDLFEGNDCICRNYKPTRQELYKH